MGKAAFALLVVVMSIGQAMMVSGVIMRSAGEKMFTQRVGVATSCVCRGKRKIENGRTAAASGKQCGGTVTSMSSDSVLVNW